ncbi:MAG TPA: helix-turn-helix domain-containing protein [Methylocystis sp.]|nr:helix-turn-helix domain-containing protein [Methylocystis sp.]
MNIESGVRRRILDAALDIAERQGIQELTQPKIARAAGVRQSHLTYYFPRKADLYAALLRASHKRAEPASREAVTQSLANLMFDRQRMRFFLGVVLEIGGQPDLAPALSEHARELSEQVAPLFGRGADDPTVAAFIDALRGAGLRLLLEPDARRPSDADLCALADRFGLKPL